MARSCEQRAMKGMIFDLKHYAVHDGPGIRTTVFLKGCPLNCLWCHNPESQNIHQEIMFYSNLCIDCRECIEVCPQGAITSDMENKIRRDLCTRCGKCVESCWADALRMVGEEVTVEEVVERLEKDELFYRNSGGGVTLSGGEPTAQPEFTLELLRRCREKGYHTALDTCGYLRWETLEGILENVDLVLYDLKHTDSEKHREQTGVLNELILENLKRMDETGQSYVIRVPLIPGYNDSDETVDAMATFLSALKNVGEVELLPYDRFGVSKYRSLGREYPLKGLVTPSSEHVKKIEESIRGFGLRVRSHIEEGQRA